jgi:hypothetical protein
MAPKRWFPFLLILVLSLQVGCLKAAPEDTETEEGRAAICEYWPEKLTVAAKVERALALIREAECSSALPKLEELFDNDTERARVIDAVRDIGDRSGSVGILRKALGDSSLAQKAATIVSDWKLTELKPELIKLVTAEGSIAHRRSGLNALLSISSAQEHEDLLITLATANPNLQDLQVHEKAVKALAAIGSKKGAGAMVTAAFLRNQVKRHIYPSARLALSKIPRSAVKSLALVATGDLEILNQMASELSIPQWELSEGQFVTQLLADTLDADAGPVLAQNLSKPHIKPVGVSESECPKNPKGLKCSQFMKWTQYTVNRRTFASLGLGKVEPNDMSVPILVKLATNNADTIDTVSHRLAAANALSYMGTAAAIRGLFEAWDMEPDWNRDPKDADKRADFLALLVRPLAISIGYGDLPEFDKRLKNPEKYTSWAEHVKDRIKLPGPQGVLKALRDCKTTASCWLKRLDDPEKDVFLKAVVMLARGLANKVDARQALLARLAKTTDARTDVDYRTFCLMGLARVGDARTGEKLIEMANSPAVGEAFWKQEFTVLGNALIARGG